MSIALVSALAPYFSTYTRSFTWTQAAANTQFELQVNDTQQTIASVSVSPVFTYGTDQYCEVYTLTDQGNVPIIITATVTGSGATPVWMSNNVAYLAPGQVTAMVLYFTSFTNTGTTNTVTFNSAAALSSSDQRVTSYTVAESADADSGQFGNGYWAIDNFNQNIQIYSTGTNTYEAFVDYVGSWQTWAGIASPAAATLQGADGTGSMLFSYAATFTTTEAFPTTGTTITASGGAYTSGGQIWAGGTPYHWYSDGTYFSTPLAITEIDSGGAGEQALYTYGTLVYNTPLATQAQIWTGFGIGHSNIVIPA